MKDDCCWEFLTFLNYVASRLPRRRPGRARRFTEAERKRDPRLLASSTGRSTRRYLKGYLALTLQRAGARRRTPQLVLATA